jgi:hypothetical protein
MSDATAPQNAIPDSLAAIVADFDDLRHELACHGVPQHVHHGAAAIAEKLQALLAAQNA